MAIVLAAAVSLPALFVADGYVAADYTVDQRAQESSSRLVAKKDINSSALLAERLYVADDYYADGYTDDPRRAEGYALIPATLVRDQDTIGIFPVSSTLAGPALTQAAGAQSDVNSASFAASFRVETTGMAASATSTTIMPFGMSKDAGAVSSQNKNPGEFYVTSGYAVTGYVEDSPRLYTNSLVAAEAVRNGHFIPVASSATDVGVTQVHALGAAVEALVSSTFAGSRIESTGYLSSASATTLIPMTRVKETGYRADGTSATDAGGAATKGAGAQSRSGIGTSKITEMILRAGVNSEPERTLLNTTVTIVTSGGKVNVKVGDITRNGSVSAFDSSKYAQYLAGTLTDADMLDHIENVLHPWLTENASDLLNESHSLIAGSFTAGFGALIESQATTPIAGQMTASFGVKVEGDATTIIAPRLKWETVSEPTDIWTTINDDSYPFG